MHCHSIVQIARADLKGGVLPSALAFRLESAPFSARFLGHEGATLHGQTSAVALLTTTLNTRDGQGTAKTAREEYILNVAASA